MIESIGIVWVESYLCNFFKYSIGHFLSNKNILLIKEKKLNFNIIFKESEKNLVKKIYIFIFEIKCFFKKIKSIFFNMKNNYE